MIHQTDPEANAAKVPLGLLVPFMRLYHTDLGTEPPHSPPQHALWLTWRSHFPQCDT
jgi:hypothetical protein